MASSFLIIIYFIDFISMICAACTALKLYVNGKNYIIAVLSAGMAFGEFIIFLSVIWVDDFNKIPKGFCFFQALAFQYAVYLQVVAAVCFSFHIYQLLVRYKQGMSLTLQRVYMSAMIVAPIIMTIAVAIVTVKTDAIRPGPVNCDIKKPIWVRLFGYSGFNLALTFPGVYFSARAAYKVFRHLDQFKDKISNQVDSQDSTTAMTTNMREIQIHVDTSAEITTTTTNTRNTITSSRRSKAQSRANQIKAYNMTKNAAIRMVLFSCGFALINVLASFQTIMLILKNGLFGEVEVNGIGGNDISGITMGLMIFLVFGLPNSVKRCFSRKKK